ncbi:MAG: ATP-binding protein [Patescibacteria group bacterium]|nr:ATP-binding protein [Patescibacteria group bacterium]
MNNIFYNRKIYPNIKEHLLNRQITVITGMRRVGKTTLVNKILSEVKSKNKAFFDLQKISNRELFAQKNYDNIILDLSRQGIRVEEKIYLAIDEIQLLPEITGAIKYLYDHYDIKFIITGSSSYYLKNFFSESLSGRKKIFELYPLDFGEFLEFKQIKWRAGGFLSAKFSSTEYERLRNFYEEYLEFGGFPEVVLLSAEKEKRDLLSDIISSYLNIDIKNLSDFRDSQNLYNLIKMLAARAGAKLDYSKLASLSGLSRPTVMNYLNLFEKTYLISRVPVYTKNIDREIVKAQKIYFNDNGFLNILADLSGGAKFENAVFNQLKSKGEVRYYSLKNGREIDFVLDKKTALETKENPTKADLKNLAELSKTAGLPEYRLIGRHQAAKFADYIWGGEIK